MNHLNSIILEGIIKNESLKWDSKKVEFQLETQRFFKEDGEFSSETSIFDAQIRTLTPEDTYKKLENTKGIRIIGKLRIICKKVIIDVDHFEISPVREG